MKFARINISDCNTIYRGGYDTILILAFCIFFHTKVSAPLIIAKGKLRYIDLCNKFSSNNIELKRYGPHPDLKR